LSETILQVCKELIDDAKIGCANLVFKEVCLEILSRARNVLTENHFNQLLAYTEAKMKDDTTSKLKTNFLMKKVKT
jgi:hypothetical protein